MAQSAWSLAVSQGANPNINLPGKPSAARPWVSGYTGGGYNPNAPAPAGPGAPSNPAGGPGNWSYVQPAYVPPPTGGGAAPPQALVMPNPGDVDEYGNIYEPNTGQFLPPNFFFHTQPGYNEFPNWNTVPYGNVNIERQWAPYYGIDPGMGGMGFGGYGYGGGGGGGGGGEGGEGGPPGSASATWKPPEGAIMPRPAGQYDYLSLPESLAGYIPPQYRAGYGSATNQFLTGLGYQGMGNIGQYGERSYAPPQGAQSPFYIAPDLFSTVNDPALAPWLQYVLGEYGYTDRITQPVLPPAA